VFPQGSVLGHLLFLLCINDTFDLFTGSVSVKLFADDIKIYMEVNGMSQITDLQECIDDIAAWARTWQLKLSVNKCQHMRITLRKSVGRVSYLLDGVVLPTVSTYIDLGVYVDST